MGSYIPSSVPERALLLSALGLSSMEELFQSLPEAVRLKKPLSMPEGKSEMEVLSQMEELASQNKVFSSIFRGAGAYWHYIPAVVKSAVSKEPFLTAYTPYQPEIAQGILQSIFEFQTMICELTGMDAANASIYDGATAAAEGVAMCRGRNRETVLISASVNPMTLETVKTYCHGAGAELKVVPTKDGVTDKDALASLLGGDTACLYIEQPNFFGLLEDANLFGTLVHEQGGKLVMGVNPIAAAILKTPRECGADVCVGEGQPLGLPLSFGGPYLGFMTATTEMMRKLPGRIVGETTDANGERAFVLTLQAREQHIRREKASSNVCSNQALCALTAAAYLAAMGAEGLREVASQCHSKAEYAKARMEEAGFHPLYPGEFFHEFVTSCPVCPKRLEKALEGRGILGGLPVEGGILWCVTERCTKEAIDQLIDVLKECGEACSK